MRITAVVTVVEAIAEKSISSASINANNNVIDKKIYIYMTIARLLFVHTTVVVTIKVKS